MEMEICDLDYQIPVTQPYWRYASSKARLKRSHLPAVDRFKRVALEWAWQIFFEPIDRCFDETNTFQLKFLYYENCGRHRLRRIVGVRVGMATFFLGQSIGIDETNTFQLKFFSQVFAVCGR